MYGSLSTQSELHRQDLLRSAEQRRLAKQAPKPTGTFYKLLRTTLAERFEDVTTQVQDLSIPAHADHAQVKFETGVFNAL